jgi:hemolysin activation/secretion protein
MNHTYLITTSALLCTVLPALAQQAGDRALQENAPRQLTAPQPARPLTLPAPADPTVAPARGISVALRSVTVSGNTAISQADLLAALGPVTGKSYDFAGLNALATRVSNYYREHGYPFARAYLPRQQLSDGNLSIQVLEGRYDRVVAQGEPAFTGRAQQFLSALEPGGLIESSRLERATLILDDLPGIETVPVIRPGREVGAADLLVEVKRDHRYAGEVGIDNFGNRYTGRTRGHANLDIDSPFMLGDQILLQALYTDQHMWFGSVGYALPLGASGLRGRIAYAHSYYALAENFSALNATGTADVSSAMLSYPLIRSQQRNLSLSGGIEHKRLNDEQGATDSAGRKSTDSIPMTANFDLRDNFLRGAVTYGAVSLTSGRLHLDNSLLAADQATGGTSGRFTKLNLDLARIQAVAPNVDLYGRISAQWANKNLDSSQKFGLGGKYGVRAYPSGEGYGDEGVFAQVEFRYALGSFAPYVFYDIGHVTINHRTWATGENSRQLGGAGTGVRYFDGRVKAELVLAWRTQGGAPRSDTRTTTPAVWANLDYRF